MYKSPIDIVMGRLKTEMDVEVLKAVQSYDINVDKEELIKALNYDRNQYEKGLKDGKDDALQYVIERGERLLQCGTLTPDMALGISLILGIAKVTQKELRGE